VVSVLVGVLWLFVVVSLVRTLDSRNVRPYLLSYMAVILTGFYGMVGITNFFFPMLLTNPVEAALNGALFIAALRVAYWGLNTFKRLQVQV
jgi:hypothetical protein